MEREPKVPPDVIKNLAEGLMKAGWGTTVREAQSEEEMKVVLISEEGFIVEIEEDVKPIQFGNVAHIRFTNPNPKP